MKPVVDGLLAQDAVALVKARDGDLLSLRAAVIPNLTQAPGRQLWCLVNNLASKTSALPSQKITEEWARVILDWPTSSGGALYDVDALLAQIAGFGNLENLSAGLIPREGSEDRKSKRGVVWLNQALRFMLGQGLRQKFNEAAVIPNQLGEFRKEGELQLGIAIEDELKCVCEKLGVHIRKELLHEGLWGSIQKLFLDSRGKTIDAASCLERAITEATVFSKGWQGVDMQPGAPDRAEGVACLLKWAIDAERQRLARDTGKGGTLKAPPVPARRFRTLLAGFPFYA